MTKASVVAMLLVAAASVAAQERAPNRSEPSALAWEGQRAFTVQGCYGCHTIGKFGTPIGPDLSHIAVRLSRRDLERWIRDPASQRPSAHMPKLELSDDDINALAAYLSSLR